MTKDEENQLTMIESTTGLLDANSEKLAAPALKSAVADLGAVLLKAKQMVQETMTASLGKAESKARAEDEVIGEIMVASKGLFAYGFKVRDPEIMEKARVTPTYLRRMRDTEFVAKARTVHEVCVEYSAELADFGITPERLEALKSKIDLFEKALGERESSVARRKGARYGFYDYLNEAKDLLENLIDNMMEPFKKTDPQFYNEYTEARVVKDLGIRHRAEEEQPAEAK